MDDERYSLQELADAASVSPRTVRYYIAEGLLQPPEPAGHRTSYTRDHLTRLKLIGLLKEAFLPLREIRTRLTGLDSGDLDRALEEAERVRVPANETYESEQSSLPPGRTTRSSHNETRLRRPDPSIEERSTPDDEDALAYIDRVLGKQRPAWSPPKPVRVPSERDKVWRRLPIGASGDAELVISESLYQRRKDRIDALLVWAEKMFDQD